jgi:hypothetical protein
MQAQGYNVESKWVNGFDTKPLLEADVACPNGDDDGFGFRAGIG